LVQYAYAPPKDDQQGSHEPATAAPKQAGGRVEDPKEAYTAEQLAEVGAIVLIWNQIDVMVDFLLYVSLRLQPPIMFFDVTRRINGISNKMKLLHLVANKSKILDDEARKCIKLTLDGVIECKRYRDNLVHSVPYDIDKVIVHTLKQKIDMVQTLVTMDALKVLYFRLKLLLNEVREVDLLYQLADEDGAGSVYGRELFDPLERRRTRDVPLQTARVQERQKERQSLPPLPGFPDEDEGLAPNGELDPHS
jgi:hypothetical protein